MISRILKSISVGILAALAALVFETVFSTLVPGMQEKDIYSDYTIIFTFVSIEEIIKFGMIYKKFYLDEASEKIFSKSFFLAIGFSLIEIGLIFSNDGLLLRGKPQLLPILGILSVHTATTMISAYIISKRPYHVSLKILVVLAINMMIHFIYNFFVINVIPN